MSILNAKSLRLFKVGTDREYYIFKDLSLAEGEIGLLVCDNHEARQILFRRLLGQSLDEYEGWHIDGDITVCGSKDRIPFGQYPVLLVRNPDSQISGCFREMLLEFSLPLALMGKELSEQRVAAEFWLAAFGLRYTTTISVSHLSTGQKQRLMLASTVAIFPKLLLVDGPLEFIDPQSRYQLIPLLKQVCMSRGTAILFAASSDNHFDVRFFDKVFGQEVKGVIPRHDYVNKQITLTTSDQAPIDYIKVSDMDYFLPKISTQLYQGLSFSLPEGSGVVIVGPNGSGKSTLGQILAGRIVPSCGSVEVGGLSARTWFVRRQPQIICSFTDPDLTITKTSVRNEINSVAVGLMPEEHFERIIALLGLDKVLDTHPFDLNWHIRRRLAIAKAIRAAKKGVFIDEPAADSSIDERTKFVAVLNICIESGLSIVVATNDELVVNCLPFNLVVRLPRPITKFVTDGNKTANLSPLRVLKSELLDLTNQPKWELNTWSTAVNDWFEHTPEFSTFWASSVYPYLFPLLESIRITSPFVMVDLACGHGLHTMNVARFLQKTGVPISSIIGVDAQPKFVEVAQNIFRGMKDCSFMVLDLTDSASMELLASALLEKGLPVLFTAFFALHDLSSLSELRKLLARTHSLGGVFLAALISPDYVQHVSGIARQEIWNERHETIGHDSPPDWLWSALYPVSAQTDQQLYIPYFHREIIMYKSLLKTLWTESYNTTFRPNGKSVVIEPNSHYTLSPSSRDDEVMFLWADYRLPGQEIADTASM